VWAGVFAPKGLPADVMKRLNDALDQTLDDAGVQKRVADLGGAIPKKDERMPAAFGAYVKTEIDRWSPILKEAGANTN
jgi:tripartite-type tricarboxylate transporter receptor subunit TctC